MLFEVSAPSSQRDSLLATFNSGFKMVDSNGGYWQDGRTAVPLRRGAASMVLYKDGHLDVVTWNAGTPGRDVAAVRQNLVLLLDHGAITAAVNNGTAWGNTVGNATFVWRTALGVRVDGSLVFWLGPQCRRARWQGSYVTRERFVPWSWTSTSHGPTSSPTPTPAGAWRCRTCSPATSTPTPTATSRRRRETSLPSSLVEEPKSVTKTARFRTVPAGADTTTTPFRRRPVATGRLTRGLGRVAALRSKQMRGSQAAG
jgi:hypothetical protein